MVLNPGCGTLLLPGRMLLYKVHTYITTSFLFCGCFFDQSLRPRFFSCYVVSAYSAVSRSSGSYMTTIVLQWCKRTRNFYTFQVCYDFFESWACMIFAGFREHVLVWLIVFLAYPRMRMPSTWHVSVSLEASKWCQMNYANTWISCIFTKLSQKYAHIPSHALVNFRISGIVHSGSALGDYVYYVTIFMLQTMWPCLSLLPVMVMNEQMSQKTICLLSSWISWNPFLSI